MFRKLVLAAALALPLASFGSAGALGPVAHAAAQVIPIDNGCETSYPWSGSPYSLFCPVESSVGGDVFFGGLGPYEDPTSVGIHWTGTSGSYANFPCIVPSIVTGQDFGTVTSSEMDFLISEQTDTVRISLWCQAQTLDSPGKNLFANLTGNNFSNESIKTDSITLSACWSQGLGGPGFSNTFSNNFYVAENATGVATLHCNFDEPLIFCGSGIVPSISFSPFGEHRVGTQIGFSSIKPDC